MTRRLEDQKLREERRLYRLARMEAEAVLQRARPWLQTLPEEERRVIEEKIRRIAALAQSLGRDFNLKLEPGDEWHYDFETNTIRVPLAEVREKPVEYLLACAVHEAGHRRISRVTDPWFFQRESRRLLLNGVEDPRANAWMMHEYAGVREHYFEPLYEEIFPSDPASPLLWPFPFLLPHVQFVLGLVHRWAHDGADHPLIGEEVREALDEAWPVAREIWETLPKIEDPNEREIWEAARKATRRIREEIWPIYGKLVEEAIAQVKEGLRDGTLQIDERGLPSGLSAGELPGWARELMESAPQPGKAKGLSPEDVSRLAQAIVEEASRRAADILEARVERDDLTKTKESAKEEFDLPQPALEPPPSDLETIVAWEAERARVERAFDLYKRQIASPYGRYRAEVAGLIDELAGFLETILEPNVASKKEGFFRSGTSIHLRKYLQEKGSGSPDRAIFLHRTKRTRRDYRFSLLLDGSGSMRAGKKDFNAICAAVLFLEVLERLQIDFEIAGFHSTHLVHKGFSQQLKAADKEELITEIERMMGSGATHDVEAIHLALDRVKEEPAEEKVIMVITDGQGNGPGSMPEAIARARAEEVRLIGIGVGEGTEYVKEQYDEYVLVGDIRDLPTSLAVKLEQLILFGI